jgi:MoaA/NifB/PqqE/SkfB family radical SAM enzyme
LDVARRRLDALQVEVTSRCSRRCAVCPRSALADRWVDGDLSSDLWRRLLPDLPMAEHVHLQGWGEPLLHPELRSMAADAAAAGCRVGITTNGDLLRAAMDWIVTVPLDVVAVSVAGGDGTNVRLRDGVATGDLLQTLAELARRRTSAHRPRLHLSYLLTRENAGELETVVERAAGVGVDAILVNHLDVAPTAELRALAAYGEDGVRPEVRDALRGATAVARRRGVDLRAPVTDPQDMLVCDLDPRRILSVGWDGRVAPCVALNLPVEGPVPRATETGLVQVETPSLGHLAASSLCEILASDAYRSFVAPFEKRVAADARCREWGLLASGWGVVALADLDRMHAELESALAANPFPEACTGCPGVDGW